MSPDSVKRDHPAGGLASARAPRTCPWAYPPPAAERAGCEEN